eukprot:CAMPEP_0206199284 /NCGR_PEP_ID=MMETSP0166-20121206/10176_1 /ASSEMBLY_ACC=CAM_ASM_000260 /TAXON_ID=95228 /ORGANISM="Vannella robusta, Strain DIVA3 518/3/11/1/6" /LENGTH=820 /DNA_ID=CAMNT_0053617369 /DNA_START=39 /DNA_END=2498 /DNA_ORIENTATION=+
MTASLDGFCGIDAPDQDHVDWLSLGSDITAAKYNKGEYLITEGEKVEHLMIITEGEVVVESNSGETSTRSISASEIYGESCFLNRPAVVSVKASKTCTVLLLNLAAETEHLFEKDPLFAGNKSNTPREKSKTISIQSSPLRTSVGSYESPRQEDLKNFMQELKVTRVPSDPHSQGFRQAKTRQELFYNIAAKLIYRLQDSIDKFSATLPSPDFSKPLLPATSKLSNELKPVMAKKGHRRTPSKTFVGKMLQRAVSGMEDMSSPRGKKNDKATEKFVKKFRLPKSEKLLQEYEVSWIPEGDGNPLEGRLFVGQSYLCFLGNGFAFNMKTVTPMNTISSWKIVHRRLVISATSEGETTKIVYALHDSHTQQLEEFMKNYTTNSKLLQQRPQSLVRKESWVMRHNIDPVASESFDLQDCILLLDCSVRHLYKQGDTIIKANADNTEPGMWKIASGRVKIENKDGTIIAVLGKNSFFGEISFFFPEVSSTASIIALDDIVEVFFLKGDKLNQHFRQFPNFGARFYKYITTIVAHRFERFNRLFMSEYANHICRQKIAKLKICENPEVHPHEEEIMVQLTTQFLKVSSTQATIGKISLVDLLSLKLEEKQIVVDVRGGSQLTFDFSTTAREWMLAIDSAASSSYGIKFLSFDQKTALIKDTYKPAEDCEIQFCEPNGHVEEQWFYNPVRGTVISLSVDRSAQCSWDGCSFIVTDPKGNHYPGYGVWDGLRAFWYPNSIQQEGETESDFDAHSTRFGFQCYVWYDTVMTFQNEIGRDSFTMHNTKIQKRGQSFDKALKFKNQESGPKPPHLVADIHTPVPLLLFLS